MSEKQNKQENKPLFVVFTTISLVSLFLMVIAWKTVNEKQADLNRFLTLSTPEALEESGISQRDFEEGKYLAESEITLIKLGRNTTGVIAIVFGLLALVKYMEMKSSNN